MNNDQALPLLSHPIRDRWALLVGINDYIDPNFSPLKFCVRDVQALEQVLQQSGYTVLCLHDAQTDRAYLPSRDNIEDALIRLSETVRAEDLLLVHFACHGKLVEQTPVLIAQDTRYNLMAKRSLSLAEIEGYMRKSQAKRLVLSLDACHAGVDIGRAVTDPEFIQNVYDLAEGFALLSASTAQQVAQEWDDEQHGVYTYYLLEAFQGKADREGKGVVTVRDVLGYVTDQMRRWVIRHGGLLQEPTLRSEGLGDMILRDFREHPVSIPESTSVVRSGAPSVAARDVKPHFPQEKAAISRLGLKSPVELREEQLEQEYGLYSEAYAQTSRDALLTLDPVQQLKLRRQADELYSKLQAIDEEIQRL